MESEAKVCVLLWLEDYNRPTEPEDRWSDEQAAEELLAALEHGGFEVRRKERPAPEFGPGGGA